MRYLPAIALCTLQFQVPAPPAVAASAHAVAAAQAPQESQPPAQPKSPSERPPVSVFSETLHLGEAPPELRALRVIQVRFEGSVGSPRKNVKTREEAERFTQELRARVAAGADFAELARRHSDASNARCCVL